MSHHTCPSGRLRPWEPDSVPVWKQSTAFDRVWAAQPSLDCLSFCPQSLYFLSGKTTASLKASACREQNRPVRKITLSNILCASVPSYENQTTTLSLGQVPLFFLYVSQVSFAFCLNVCSLSPKAFLRLVPFMYLSSLH